MPYLNDIKDLIIRLFTKCLSFLTEKQNGTRETLKKSDYADIFIALLPVSIFGCLLFGFRAVFVLLVSLAACIGADISWDIIFKKQRNGINYSAIVTGLLLGLTLSSALNIGAVVLTAVLTIVLIKTLLKNNNCNITLPILVTRILLGIVFFKAFSEYLFPFLSIKAEWLPIESLFISYSYSYPAKYLFFGLHSGNIGETSVLLIMVGGIYLIIRKLINPIIPITFITTSAVLSLIFWQDIALSLMGGGLCFAAIFMTMDYSFKDAPRYKKILYGIVCGILTFVLRILFRTESVLLAIFIADLVFLHLNRRNIKRFISFVKKPDFKKLLSEFKKAFSV